MTDYQKATQQTTMPRQIKIDQALFWIAKAQEEIDRAEDKRDFWKQKLEELQNGQ